MTIKNMRLYEMFIYKNQEDNNNCLMHFSLSFKFILSKKTPHPIIK